MKINDLKGVLAAETYITILVRDGEPATDIKVYGGCFFKMPSILLDKKIFFMVVDYDELVIVCQSMNLKQGGNKNV